MAQQAEQVKFVLRLPPSLHKKIKRSAKANNTSMNKEITNILNDSFTGLLHFGYSESRCRSPWESNISV
ncbi:MAG: Arc family DNA-binding protein [Pseudomonadales bacterium]|jgi:hypothetical protein|nr:Arc family DNA-binding protein [Pseudomonadales bacterium]